MNETIVCVGIPLLVTLVFGALFLLFLLANNLAAKSDNDIISDLTNTAAFLSYVFEMFAGASALATIFVTTAAVGAAIFGL